MKNLTGERGYRYKHGFQLILIVCFKSTNIPRRSVTSKNWHETKSCPTTDLIPAVLLSHRIPEREMCKFKHTNEQAHIKLCMKSSFITPPVFFEIIKL